MNFLITIIIALLFSCTSSVPVEPEIILEIDDSSFYEDQDTVRMYYSDEPTDINEEIIYEEYDTTKKKIFRRDKKIKPIELDSIYIVNRDSNYKQLDVTQKEIIKQQEKIDSLLIIKKK